MANVSGYSVRIKGKYLFTVKPSSCFLILFLTLLAIFMALPIIYLTVTAFKPIDELYLFPPTFFTRRPSLSNFKSLFNSLNVSDVPFLRYVFNSLFVTVLNVIAAVIVCSLGAFGMVKQRPVGSELIFSVILAALMFPAAVTQIPNYLIVKSMGMLESYASLVVPKIAVAFNFFLMKQFMEQLPDAYLEAARVDGAGELKIYWKIIMPMMTPAWATLIVFSFITNWNDYLSPLLYITNSPELKTLPLAVQMIAGGTGAAAITTAGAVAAATFCMTVPVIAIYLLMQRNVLNTMAYSGIK